MKSDPKFGFEPSEIHGFDQDQDGFLDIMLVKKSPKDGWAIMYYVHNRAVRQTQGNSLSPQEAVEYYGLLRSAIDSLLPVKK